MCDETIEQEAHFTAIDFDELPDSPLTGHHVVLALKNSTYLFTDWSRLQLLSHLGTKEKWFIPVTKRQQADELTQRVHTFQGHRLRTTKTQEPSVCVLRGLVSKEYAEIPDTDIMLALQALLPAAKVVASVSKKTDRALYAYVVADETPIGLRGKLMGYPGFIMKNSEVGYTSLWLIPFLYLETRTGAYRPIAFEKKVLLRKVHRGSVADLRESFDSALKKLSEVWGPITERMAGLQNILFATEDLAVERLRYELGMLKETKAAMLAYEHTYRSAKHIVHDGLSILQAVLTSSRAKTADASYDEAELAGALLLRLL